MASGALRDLPQVGKIPNALRSVSIQIAQTKSTLHRIPLKISPTQPPDGVRGGPHTLTARGGRVYKGCIGKKGAPYAACFRDLMNDWGVPGFWVSADRCVAP